MPKQTLQSFKESLDYCKQFNSTVYAFPLMLLRGTELHQRREELGLIESNQILPDKAMAGRVQDEMIPHVVESPSFTLSDWEVMASMAADLDEWNNTNKMQSFLSHMKSPSKDR